MYVPRPLVGVVVVVALGASISPVRAADRTVLGKVFAVKDPAPGGDPAGRSIAVKGKEPLSSDSIVGDPLANGATVEIIANGAIPSAQVFVLPAGAPVSSFAGWRPIGQPVAGYRYRDPLGINGPVTEAVIEKTSNGTFRLTVTVKGENGPGPQPHVSVVPPTPGTDGGMRFVINGGDTYCVAFGGAAGGTVRNLPTKGVPNKVFKVSSTSAAPTSETGCPTSVLPTTTTIATTSTSSSSSVPTTTSTSSSVLTTTSTSSTIETSSTSTSRSTSSSTSTTTSTLATTTSSSTSTTTSSSSSTTPTTSATTSTSSSTSTSASTSTSTSSTVPTATNFDVDPNVRVCYNFEAGALTADARSGSATPCGSNADELANDGGVTGSTPAQEGALSADYSPALAGVGFRCNAGCPDWDVSAANRFTFAVWIRPSAVATIESPIIGRIGLNVFQYYATIPAADGKVHLKVTDAACAETGVDIASASAVPLDGTWTHVAGTYDVDTGETRLYINGKLDASSTAVSGALCATQITWNAVGDNGGGSAPYGYFGNLDEVRLFDRALGAAEICGLCQSGAGGTSSHTCAACP